MFTGIIKSTGRITGWKMNSVTVKMDTEGLVKGGSVAVNGVCLTAVNVSSGAVVFEVAPKTKELTNLAQASEVNIELPVKPSDFFSGHFVTGHVDGTVRLSGIEKYGEFRKFRFTLSEKFADFIAERGSVALDGVSLTVEGIGKNSFSVNVIPETLKRTNFSERKEGDAVNFEADVISRYAVNFLKKEKEGLTEEKLKKWL
ncbi:MAG: riboflavin synthase [bacterium]